MNPFSDEQHALRDVARDFFAQECTVQHLRRAWNDGEGPSRDRWKAMADLGLLGLGVPAEHGGLGVSPSDLVLILEEAGYAGLPEPLVESIAVVGPIIATFGTDEQQAQWLPRIATGEVLATVLIMDGEVAPAGDLADVVLVAQGGEAHIVAREQFTSTKIWSLDRALASARVDADTDTSTQLQRPSEALHQAEVRSAAASAAVLNGVSRRLLDMSVKYAMEREQFGRKIGSFQAVKHMLAGVASAVETARPSAWEAAAAMRLDAGQASIASSVAKAAANEAGFEANYVALQVHGGIGFTWEHDLHFWLKRGKTLEASYGSSRHHHRRLGDFLMSTSDLSEAFVPSPTEDSSNSEDSV